MSGGFACLFRIRRLLAFALLGFGTGDIAHAAKGLFQNFLVQLAHPVAKGGRHKQLAAVLGIRKKRDTELPDTLRLEQLACSPAEIPPLTQLPESRYALPAQPITVNTFKGERFNQRELEQQLRRSDSFAQMMVRSELDSGVKHPLLPLSISQIGLIGGSGMINGLIECDTPHIIKGRIIKVVRTESEEKFNYRGDHMGSEITETISNKMIFNVLTPNGFKALT